MIDADVIEHLEAEVDRLKIKYNPKTIGDLERIARDEYGVVAIVETPLMYKSSRVIKDQDGLYIFYYVSFKPFEMCTLAHEIGHIVAGHLDGRNPGLFRAEAEANYFSRRLGDISPSRFWWYLCIDAVLSFKGDFLNLFRRGREVERLTCAGVYHLIE